MCCKLVAVTELAKPPGVRCRHQRHGKGCMIYARRPPGCRVWNCRWLIEDDTADLRRPDRVHYAIDIMPDYVTLRNNSTGERTAVQVVQIWNDADFPLAYRDPDLMRFIERRSREGIAAIVRFSGTKDAITIFAPAMTHDGEWKEVRSEPDEGRNYDFRNVMAVLAGETPP